MVDINVNFKLCGLSNDPDGVIEWCMDVGLIASRYVCPVCGEEMKLSERMDLIDKKEWHCNRNGHMKCNRSIRKGSWFERSKLSMYEILMITKMWCMKIENDWIMAELGVSSRTVCDWENFCRELCVECVVRENEMLGGDGVIVEINESQFGEMKYARGKYVEGNWVFGGVERGTNKCFMVVVSERSKYVLLKIIKEYVRPGSIIISDCWKAYDCLKDESYQQLAVTHSINLKDPETGAHTNLIEGTWAAVKHQLNCHSNKDNYNNYLFEYMWRRKYCKEKRKLLPSFFKAVKNVFPPQTHD